MRDKSLKALALACALAFSAAALTASRASAQNQQESANGHGTLLVTSPSGEQVRRQFSFSARLNNDGTVTGQAVIHNPAFITPDGKYRANIDISCMKVVGNTAFLGGTVRRTNDPNLTESAFFIVQDNGEPGKGKDSISYVFFDNQVGPETCQGIQPGDFGELIPIESGNIQVRQ